MLRFIASSLALVGTAFFVYVFEGGELRQLFLPSPLISLAAISGFAVLAVWSIRDWGRAWKDAFTKESGSSSAATSMALWAFYEKTCYAAGVLAFLLGLVIVGSNTETNALLSQFGKVMALDCTSLILAILFAMVARILRARVEKNAQPR